MKKLGSISVLLVFGAVLFIPVGLAGAGQNNLNCTPENFQYQEDAQAVLDQDPSDPNGLDAHPGPADGNDQAGGDGTACESLPHRPTEPTETLTPPAPDVVTPLPAAPAPRAVAATPKFTG